MERQAREHGNGLAELVRVVVGAVRRAEYLTVGCSPDLRPFRAVRGEALDLLVKPRFGDVIPILAG